MDPGDILIEVLSCEAKAQTVLNKLEDLAQRQAEVCASFEKIRETLVDLVYASRRMPLDKNPRDG